MANRLKASRLSFRSTRMWFASVIHVTAEFLIPATGCPHPDLKSIRNACFVNTQVTGIVPVSCTLKFSATSLKTGAVNTEWAVFNAKSLTEPFATTTFPDSFKCAKRVDITLVSAAIPGDAVTVGAALDDVEYVAHVRT